MSNLFANQRYLYPSGTVDNQIHHSQYLLWTSCGTYWLYTASWLSSLFTSSCALLSSCGQSMPQLSAQFSRKPLDAARTFWRYISSVIATGCPFVAASSLLTPTHSFLRVLRSSVIRSSCYFLLRVMRSSSVNCLLTKS